MLVSCSGGPLNASSLLGRAYHYERVKVQNSIVNQCTTGNINHNTFNTPHGTVTEREKEIGNRLGLAPFPGKFLLVLFEKKYR